MKFRISSSLSAWLVLVCLFAGPAAHARVSTRETTTHWTCRWLLNASGIKTISNGKGGRINVRVMPLAGLFFHSVLETENGDIALETKNKESGIFRATSLYPKPLLRRGYYLRTEDAGNNEVVQILHVPGTKLANQALATLDGTAEAKPFRFADRFPGLAEGQKYSSEEFLEAIVQGKVLLATRGAYLIHDRLQEHIVAVLFMPPEVFKGYQMRALFLLQLA